MSQHHQFLKAIRQSAPEIRRQALEYAPRDRDHAAVLAYLDPKLHRLPLGIPTSILGEGEDATTTRGGSISSPLALVMGNISFYANVGSNHSGRVVELSTPNM